MHEWWPTFTRRIGNRSKWKLEILDISGWAASWTWVVQTGVHWIYNITSKLPPGLSLRTNKYFAVFRCRYYSCCYVRLWASHCLSIRFLPHGCVIPQAASYGGGSSGQSGLVSSLARNLARAEHEGSDNRKWTSSEIMATPLFRIILEAWILHC